MELKPIIAKNAIKAPEASNHRVNTAVMKANVSADDIAPII